MFIELPLVNGTTLYLDPSHVAAVHPSPAHSEQSAIFMAGVERSSFTVDMQAGHVVAILKGLGGSSGMDPRTAVRPTQPGH